MMNVIKKEVKYRQETKNKFVLQDNKADAPEWVIVLLIFLAILAAASLFLLRLFKVI